MEKGLRKKALKVKTSIALPPTWKPGFRELEQSLHSGDSKACETRQKAGFFLPPYFRFPVKLGLRVTEAVGGKMRQTAAGTMPRGSITWLE